MSVRGESNGNGSGIPAGIFVCARPGDVEDLALPLKDHLERDFPDDEILLDIGQYPTDSKEDVSEQTRERIRSCRIMLLLIGPSWLPELSEQVGNKQDPVRAEIETALAAELQILPVLVNGATRPTAADLADFKDLSTSLPYLNCLPLRAGQDFDSDYAQLTQIIDAQAMSDTRVVPPSLVYLLAAGMLISLSIIAYFWLSERGAI